MTSQIKSKIEFLFRIPSDIPTEHDTRFSNLYLLRRDICYCLGQNPDEFGTPKAKGYFTENQQVIWPGVMAIMAGIDLLAKFAYGDQPSQVGKRFKMFVKEFISQGDEEVLYQLRNSLLHSFGLYSKQGNNEYRFLLGRNTGNEVLFQMHGSYHYVNVVRLHQLFEASIPKFKEILEENIDGYMEFESLLDKYGGTRIGTLESFS